STNRAGAAKIQREIKEEWLPTSLLDGGFFHGLSALMEYGGVDLVVRRLKMKEKGEGVFGNWWLSGGRWWCAKAMVEKKRRKVCWCGVVRVRGRRSGGGVVAWVLLMAEGERRRGREDYERWK
ncbi:hypothetical protein HAX54_013599, partial [Datura stramonium]|nr:hypothetical protein [Datura stramonium]